MNKLIIDYKQFTNYVSKICRDIATGEWKPDYIVGITRGGLFPGVMLSHYLNIPLHTLNVSLRDSSVGPESNLWMAEDALGYISAEDRKANGGWSQLESKRKNILIVDDINDQGTTLNWIMSDWRSGCLPNDEAWHDVWNNNVRFAVIVDNLASKCDVKMDYVGLEINKAEKDVWVDFPYEEWWAK